MTTSASSLEPKRVGHRSGRDLLRSWDLVQVHWPELRGHEGAPVGSKTQTTPEDRGDFPQGPLSGQQVRVA